MTGVCRDLKNLALLDDWARVDYQKIQQRIRQVKSRLAGGHA